MEMPLLKVINFRVADDTFFTIGPDNFGGFLIGNCLYNYYASHGTMRYELRDRPNEEFNYQTLLGSSIAVHKS
jgi:hypothetical protein